MWNTFQREFRFPSSSSSEETQGATSGFSRGTFQPHEKSHSPTQSGSMHAPSSTILSTLSPEKLHQHVHPHPPPSNMLPSPTHHNKFKPSSSLAKRYFNNNHASVILNSTHSNNFNNNNNNIHIHANQRKSNMLVQSHLEDSFSATSFNNRSNNSNNNNSVGYSDNQNNSTIKCTSNIETSSISPQQQQHLNQNSPKTNNNNNSFIIRKSRVKHYAQELNESASNYYGSPSITLQIAKKQLTPSSTNQSQFQSASQATGCSFQQATPPASLPQQQQKLSVNAQPNTGAPHISSLLSLSPVPVSTPPQSEFQTLVPAAVAATQSESRTAITPPSVQMGQTGQIGRAHSQEGSNRVILQNLKLKQFIHSNTCHHNNNNLNSNFANNISIKNPSALSTSTDLKQSQQLHLHYLSSQSQLQQQQQQSQMNQSMQSNKNKQNSNLNNLSTNNSFVEDYYYQEQELNARRLDTPNLQSLQQTTNFLQSAGEYSTDLLSSNNRCSAASRGNNSSYNSPLTSLTNSPQKSSSHKPRVHSVSTTPQQHVQLSTLIASTGPTGTMIKSQQSNSNNHNNSNNYRIHQILQPSHHSKSEHHPAAGTAVSTWSPQASMQFHINSSNTISNSGYRVFELPLNAQIMAGNTSAAAAADGTSYGQASYEQRLSKQQIIMQQQQPSSPTSQNSLHVVVSGFPCKMPVKTRRSRLKKGDFIESVVLEQKRRDFSAQNRLASSKDARNLQQYQLQQYNAAATMTTTTTTLPYQTNNTIAAGYSSNSSSSASGGYGVGTTPGVENTLRSQIVVRTEGDVCHSNSSRNGSHMIQNSTSQGSQFNNGSVGVVPVNVVGSGEQNVGNLGTKTSSRIVVPLHRVSKGIKLENKANIIIAMNESNEHS